MRKKCERIPPTRCWEAYVSLSLLSFKTRAQVASPEILTEKKKAGKSNYRHRRKRKRK